MGNNIYQTVGRRVRQERLRVGYTLEQLAERSGITGAFVAHIEAGRKNPTLETICKIASALDLPFSSLINEPPSGKSKDQSYLDHFARIIRGATPKQKQSILKLAKTARDLVR